MVKFNISFLLSLKKICARVARIAIFEIGTRCDTWVENLETSKGKYTLDDEFAPGSRQGLCPELHQAIRRAQGRGQRPGGAARSRSGTVPANHSEVPARGRVRGLRGRVTAVP